MLWAGRTRSMRASSMRILAMPGAKFGGTHNAIFTRTCLTFTRVPAKVHIHQSSGESAFCMCRVHTKGVVQHHASQKGS